MELSYFDLPRNATSIKIQDPQLFWWYKSDTYLSIYYPSKKLTPMDVVFLIEKFNSEHRIDLEIGDVSHLQPSVIKKGEQLVELLEYLTVRGY